MNAKESKIKRVNPANELIKKLPNVDYIQNPIIYSQLSGNFSLMQTNIMLSLIKSIRDRVASHIEPGKGIVGPLFTKDEIAGEVSFRIPLSDLGVDSKQYNDVEEAGLALLGVRSSYKYINDDGIPMKVTSNVFTKFEIPAIEGDYKFKKSERRIGYIEMKMLGETADRIFNTSNQYVEHITDIAKLCHSPRTPRMYIYLSAWRRTTSEVILDYNAVKEYLGMLEYNKDHSKIKEGGDKCPRYALFHRDVLTPAQEELQKLAYIGKVDFFFTYEPIYKGVKTRGVNPEKLKFNLIPAELAQPVEDKKAAKAWKAFCQAVIDIDKEFHDVYMTCCKPLEIKGTDVLIEMPNTFVRDKWAEEWVKVEDAFHKAFGKKYSAKSFIK